MKHGNSYSKGSMGSRSGGSMGYGYANNGSSGHRRPGFVNNGTGGGKSPAAYVSSGPVGTPTRTDFGASLKPGGGISSANVVKR